MTSPDRVVAEASLWLGTPYVHQQSTLGAGCDCLGLIRGVWRGLYGAEPEAVPPYAPDWAAAGRDTMREAAERWLSPTAEGPGAVALFALGSGPIANHCGILDADGGMIHASNAPTAGKSGVVRVRFGFVLHARAVGFWAFP